MEDLTALYRLDGSTLHPLQLSRGPWDPEAQHGGPPTAALTSLIERAAESGWWLARVSAELLAPIPLAPLETSLEIEQLSRRVAVGRVGLMHGGRVVARATGRLLLETNGEPTPLDQHHPRSVPPVESERVPPGWAVPPDLPAFHRDAVRFRWESGDFLEPGPASVWMQLQPEVIAGQAPSGHQRIAAVADIASGVSAAYGAQVRYGLINSDLDLTFVRPARSDWLHVHAVTHVGAHGTGVCVSTISDTEGVVAGGTQTLLGRPLG